MRIFHEFRDKMRGAMILYLKNQVKAMWLLIERIINKISRAYRECVFQEHLGYKIEGLRIRGKVYIINYNMTIGKNLRLYPGVMIFGDGPIDIGDNVAIGNNTILYSSNGGGISIGNDVNIAANSYIIDTDHGMKKGIKMKEQANSVAPIKIGDDVWIAHNCTILKSSVIEDGAVIGAKSLVKHKIVKDSIAVGVPAKTIKYRQ